MELLSGMVTRLMEGPRVCRKPVPVGPDFRIQYELQDKSLKFTECLASIVAYIYGCHSPSPTRARSSLPVAS